MPSVDYFAWPQWVALCNTLWCWVETRRCCTCMNELSWSLGSYPAWRTVQCLTALSDSQEIPVEPPILPPIAQVFTGSNSQWSGFCEMTVQTSALVAALWSTLCVPEHPQACLLLLCSAAPLQDLPPLSSVSLPITQSSQKCLLQWSQHRPHSQHHLLLHWTPHLPHISQTLKLKSVQF